jgi:hypothetical protein
MACAAFAFVALSFDSLDGAYATTRCIVLVNIAHIPHWCTAHTALSFYMVHMTLVNTPQAVFLV